MAIALNHSLNAITPYSTPGYTVAGLPAGSDGMIAFASNGRKVGEGVGAGTGVLVVFSDSAWRRLSDETAVTA